MLDRIPLFPLDVVLFPGEPFGLHVFEERYLLMTEEVLAQRLPIGIVLARQDEPPGVIEHAPEEVGTAAKVIATERVEDRYLLQTVGTRRFRIKQVFSEKPYQEALVEWLDEPEGDLEAARRLTQEVLEQVEAMGAEFPFPEGDATQDPVFVSHVVAAALRMPLEIKQTLLASPDAEERLRMASLILQRLS